MAERAESKNRRVQDRTIRSRDLDVGQCLRSLAGRTDLVTPAAVTGDLHRLCFA